MSPWMIRIVTWLKSRWRKEPKKEVGWIKITFPQVEVGQLFYAVQMGFVPFRKVDEHTARPTTSDPGIFDTGTIRYPEDSDLVGHLEVWDSTIGINQGYCPDCGSETFYEGPHGGLAMNIRCSRCGSEFNFIYPFECDRIKRNLPEAYHREFILKEAIAEWDKYLGRKPSKQNAK